MTVGKFALHFPESYLPSGRGLLQPQVVLAADRQAQPQLLGTEKPTQF